MNKYKIILSTILVASLSLASLTGCSEKGANEIDAAQTQANKSETEVQSIQANKNETEVQSVQANNSETEAGTLKMDNIDKAENPICIDYGPELFEVEEDKSADKIIEKIKSSKEDADAEKEVADAENGSFSKSVSEMTEFYNLDNVKLDGYKLKYVGLSEGNTVYYYIPSELLENANPYSTPFSEGVIEIFITRKDYRKYQVDELGVPEDASKEIERTVEINESFTMTDDGFAYDVDGYLCAQLEDTILTVKSPQNSFLNDDEYEPEGKDKEKERKNYELISGVANNIIKNAELVTLQG